ncbi:MAG: lipocalin-like domain-containing protein [Betaproteobacteria bacterium]|nr:lipocalin-like domain-containing protein [Betaproteobacteria bacterium]
MKIIKGILLASILCLSTSAMAADGAALSFVGAWRLQSFGFIKSNGQTKYPFGEHPDGMVMYDATGRMSTQITRGDIPPFSSEERDRASDEEVRTAYEGFVGYYGTYEVNDSQRLVTFHIAVSSFPNWVGRTLKRHYEFEETRLTLTSELKSVEGSPAILIQVWEKLAN